MRAVNLLPGDEQNEGRKVPPLPVLVGCIGTVLISALLAVMFLSASAGVATKQRATRNGSGPVRAHSLRRCRPRPSLPSSRSSVRRASQRSRTVLGQRVAWDRVLREVLAESCRATSGSSR